MTINGKPSKVLKTRNSRVWALVDKETNYIRKSRDGCLAIFDSRAAARKACIKHTGTYVAPTHLEKGPC